MMLETQEFRDTVIASLAKLEAGQQSAITVAQAGHAEILRRIDKQDEAIEELFSRTNKQALELNTLDKQGSHALEVVSDRVSRIESDLKTGNHPGSATVIEAIQQIQVDMAAIKKTLDEMAGERKAASGALKFLAPLINAVIYAGLIFLGANASKLIDAVHK